MVSVSGAGVLRLAMLARFSALKRSARLRAMGWLVLTAGVVAAAVLYVVKVRSADLVLDDTNALGYARSMHHGMGVMMGPFGTMLTEWQEGLTSPLGQALVVVVCAALLAAYFFRVAWVVDAEEQEP
jgi:hypothetical protein